jgi:hypothetical protein
MSLFFKIGAGLAIIASWAFIASLAIGGPHQYCHVNENHIEMLEPCKAEGFRLPCLEGTRCLFRRYEDARCSFAPFHTCVGGVPTVQYVPTIEGACQNNGLFCTCNFEAYEVLDYEYLHLYTCL